MNRKPAIAIAFAVGAAAIAIPIAISIHLAWRQSFDEHMATVAALAEDVLRRSETSTDQTFSIFKELVAAADPDPCSTENIRRMGRLDLASEQVQAIG
jgi:sensor c-di-GMP phosphodiesterase-like protein